ncbi:unnamed protein product [Discosporangium mesarthrocarpum]
MPFGSYEISPEQALGTAVRLVKEGKVDAVKLEGGRNRVEHVKKIVDGGIAVVGHVGLTPQAIRLGAGVKSRGTCGIPLLSTMSYLPAATFDETHALLLLSVVMDTSCSLKNYVGSAKTWLLASLTFAVTPIPKNRKNCNLILFTFRPLKSSVLGGFRAQGRTAVKARQLVDDALAIQEAGAFAVVLECVPSPVGQAITNTLEIPTIGIGAGPHTSGQVLVYHDMLGMLQHPHHAQFVPRFCKRYASVGEEVRQGLERFREEVETGVFPQEEYSPYKMCPEEESRFKHLLAKDEHQRLERMARAKRKLKDQDEYEALQGLEPQGPYGGLGST